MTRSYKRRLAVCAASFAACAALAACGGGSSSTTPPLSTPVPTTAPTSTPPPPNPRTSVSAMSLDSADAQKLSVSETGYSGTFKESDTCAPLSGAIARVNTASNGGGAASYLVSPLAAGTCSITVTDSAGRSASVSVSVSTAAITIQ